MNNDLINPKYALTLGLLSLFCCGTALAEKADREKPINIEADSVRVDDIKKTAIYEGHVLLTQGTLEIRADRLALNQSDKGVITGTATGKPAQFRQKMDASTEFAEGWAETIDYDGQTEKLKLTGQAKLKRGIEELRGNQIIYENSTSLFQAKGGAVGSPGRVRAVIRPRATGNSAGNPAPTPVTP